MSQDDAGVTLPGVMGFIIPPHVARKHDRGAARAALAAWQPEDYSMYEDPSDPEVVFMKLQDRLLRVVVELSAIASPREMHQRAALRIRCAACRGKPTSGSQSARLIAWAARVGGMAVLVAEQASRHLAVYPLEGPDYYISPRAQCLTQDHHFERDALLKALPGPGAKPATLIVDHGITRL